MKAKLDLDVLHQLRLEEGFSDSEMARELGYKTPTGYWLIEKGERKASVDILYHLAKLFDVTMEELLTVEE